MDEAKAEREEEKDEDEDEDETEEYDEQDERYCLFSFACGGCVDALQGIATKRAACCKRGVMA